LAALYAEFFGRSAPGPSDLRPWLADSADEQPAPDPNARKKRLASKAAYRRRRSADDVFREKERERARERRRNNPDKVRAQKAKRRADNYFRRND